MDKLFAKIELLQKKPEHVRRRYLYISTGVLSAAIFVFWLSLFPATLDKLENKDRNTAATGVVGPFASLMNTITEGGKSLRVIGDMFESRAKYVRQASSSLDMMGTTSLPLKISTTSVSTSSPNEAGE